MRLAGSIVQWVDDGEFNFKFTLKKHYTSDGSIDGIAKGCKVAGRMFGGYGRRVMSLPHFLLLAPGHDEAVHITDFLEVWAKSGTSVSAVDVGPGNRSVVLLGSRKESALKGRWEVREVRGSDETTRRAQPASGELQTELSQEREASGNVAGEEEVSEQGLFGERSAEKTQSGGKRNLPEEEEREGLGALKRQRKVGGSARKPTTREGGSVEKRKSVGGGDEMPKDSSTQRRTGDSSGKRAKSSRGKKADEGDSGEGDDDVEINLNAFNLDNEFFLEMQTGVQKDVVLHIHPEIILAIPDWEDAYNHRSLDKFLVDTIASAMTDCYERKDMRYTNPIFVLAPIVAPPENGEPAVRVLPADFDNSHPEKYWYYPVCGQHNARAAMMVKDHPVFDYYNFCKWPFGPIYFPDDEFNGYAHVSYDSVFALGLKFYEEWSKGKLLASDSRRWIEKPPTHEEVAKPGLSTMTDSQGLKKHVWYVKVDDPSLKKGKGKPKKGAEEKTFYVQVPEPDVYCWKELVDLTDRENKRLLNSVLNLNVVWVQTSSKKLAEQGTFSVKELVDIIKMDWIMLRLRHYLEFEYEEMNKWEWNANSTFFRSKKQLFEEFKDRGLDDKLWNESRKFFTDTTYVNKCPQFLGCHHDNNIKRTAALVNDQHFPAEWKRVVLSDYWTLVVFVPCLWNLSFMICLSALGATRCYTGKWVRKTASKKTHQFGNSVSEEPDVMHILFKGEDPRLLTHPVYEGAVAEDDDAALRRKQKVTPTDVEENYFKSLTFADIGNVTQRGALYKDGERNPNQLCNQLLFFCGVADVYVTHEVSSKAYPCDFHHVVVEPVYDPNKDMFFKLTPKKRRQVYPFLYGEQPRLRFDQQYVVRKEVAIAVLQGYHRASRAGAVSFIKRLEYVFFNEDVVDPADFTLDKYKLAFGEEDDFNIETEQEESIEDNLFDLDGELSNKWLEVSSAFYALPSSPSIKQVSWELSGVTPPAGVVKGKSRGKDGDGDGEGGGQRGTGGGSEKRSTKQWSPGHASGGEGKKGSLEKKKLRSGEKTKHHRGDGQGADVDRGEDGGVLAVTGRTSMETGNGLRPGCITRPGEEDHVISSTSETQFIDAVGGAGVTKHGTCFAQLQKRLADCLGSIQTSETTSLSGTQCLPGSETTTYHGSGSDKLEPCSVSPQKEFQINPNREGRAIEGARLSTELERVVRVSENPGDGIRIHPNQEAVSAMTNHWCQDAVMLCVEAHKELQADCQTEGELATSSNVEPNRFGAELAVVSDSPVKAVMSASLGTAGAQMNPNQGPVNISLPDASLGTTVIRIHPRHTDEGLQLAGVEGCRLLTTLDKDNFADDRIDPTLKDVGMELPVQPGYDDPLYSALHNEATGEDDLKKASDAVGDRFLYLSDDDKDTAYGDKKLRGGEVLLDIHGTLSPTQYDTVAMEKTQPADIVDVDDLCPEMNIPSTVIDADISSLSSFPVGLEHVVASSTRAGVPIGGLW
ncbi:hypothetical protein CBR_g44496 [Chara braunii]|uniref:Uncharacterized protein n=1 Tax=Chara braunii TaxID=69332 RepID=A0A388LXU9_CHABU|nr:hypothetical protein CBR_g44496 [Chara braunii]|eukprot:GBG87039.1 hypothetical protein CBR_g44496 [Chara braunii]